MTDRDSFLRGCRCCRNLAFAKIKAAVLRKSGHEHRSHGCRLGTARKFLQKVVTPWPNAKRESCLLMATVRSSICGRLCCACKDTMLIRRETLIWPAPGVRADQRQIGRGNIRTPT